MTFIIGLTGSIGMGKSTTAQMFADQGVPVWDADKAVAQLYDQGGKATQAIAALDETLIQGGIVSKTALKAKIRTDAGFLKKLEAIVHPLVAEHRAAFLANTDAPIVLLDIPLLFESGMNTKVDVVVCVAVDPKVQKQRVLDRGTMTEADFEIILAKQMPNTEKMALSDYVIQTDTLEFAKMAVDGILVNIRQRIANA